MNRRYGRDSVATDYRASTAMLADASARNSACRGQIRFAAALCRTPSVDATHSDASLPACRSWRRDDDGSVPVRNYRTAYYWQVRSAYGCGRRFRRTCDRVSSDCKSQRVNARDPMPFTPGLIYSKISSVLVLDKRRFTLASPPSSTPETWMTFLANPHPPCGYFLFFIWILRMICKWNGSISAWHYDAVISTCGISSSFSPNALTSKPDQSSGVGQTLSPAEPSSENEAHGIS